ncbi:MAG: hypothetical protein V4649_09065 [Bacteroidota bacterium]
MADKSTKPGSQNLGNNGGKSGSGSQSNSGKGSGQQGANRNLDQDENLKKNTSSGGNRLSREDDEDIDDEGTGRSSDLNKGGNNSGNKR